MEPTEQQKIIIDYDGNSVVIAAPGSGKTFVVSQKIKRNLVHLKDHEGIIAISYTNKASNELKNRSLSSGENPKSSFFGTIDKFNLCEILVPFGKLKFGIPKNELKVIKGSALEEFEAADLEWIDRNISLDQLSEVRLNTLISLFLRGIILIETIGLLSNYILHSSLACQKYLKSRYRYIYIDEYQDSGKNQHAIFMKIYNLGLVAVAVGDLNQSIFAFSFKDPKYLEELSKNDNFKYFKLDKNHRCHASIINYSNYLLNTKTELIPITEPRVFSLRSKGDESSIAEYIDKNITELKKIFSLERNNQIAILVRYARTANIIRTHLKTENRFFVTNELDSNLNIWSLIFSKLLHFIFHKQYTFVDVVEVFTTYDKFTKNDLTRLKRCKKQIQAITSKETIVFKNLKDVFVEIAEIISPSLRNTEAIELLEKTLEDSDELNSYRPANDNEINIMTLHKSKGLEFELVIHLDLYEWILPSKKPGENNDFNNPVYPSYVQDLNLHYVGITRAIKACILFTSTQRTNHDNILKKAKDSEFMSIDGIEKLRYIPS